MLPLWHVYLLILAYLDLGSRTSGQRGDLEASKLQCVIYGQTTGPGTAVPFLKKGRKGRYGGRNALNVTLFCRGKLF